MKLVSIAKSGSTGLGVVTDRGIVDIEDALMRVPAEGRVPFNVMQLLEGGEAALAALRTYVGKLGGQTSELAQREDSLQFGPCVPEPNKIICVGLNYRKHAEETNAAIPEYPILFNKFNNTLTGHKADVPLPVKVSRKIDYEAELVIVIGKKAKYVDKASALDYVFGYAAVNDISARDLQMRTSQWLLGKSCDGFSPLGPYLVTADEVGNPNDLAIKCFVNGEQRQNSNTSDMIFHCDEIVSYISQHMTLLPGDVIFTGTPEGVVLGYPPERQQYLKDGDVVTVEVEKLGAITNRMVAEA